MVAILSLFAVVTSLAVFSVPFAVNEKRAASQIQDDINALSTDMGTLNDAIEGFQTTGGTLMQFMSVAMNALTVGTCLNKLVIDVANTPGLLDDTEVSAIIATVERLQPIVITGLGNIATKKIALEGLLPGSTGTAVVDNLAIAALQGMNTLYNDAADGLVSMARPGSLKTAAISIMTGVQSSFDNAISAFRA